MSNQWTVPWIAAFSTGALLAVACGQDATNPDFENADPRHARCFQSFGDAGTSAYVLPFQVGATQTLIQSYCPTNPQWGHYDWLAYDFDTQIGDTIVASRAGSVLFVQEGFQDATRVCGQENFVFVEHDDGTVIHYMHLTVQGALVEVGDRVEQRQPIGLSGDSGCSSEPHVHVALFRNRSSFNKENTVPLNYRAAEGPVDSLGGLVQGRMYTPKDLSPGV
jgi:hypothetical protein